MKSSIVLSPELFSGLNVYVSNLFVSCPQFVIRRSLLANPAIYSDAESIKGLSATFAADCPPIAEVQEVGDESFMGYFTQDSELGIVRTKFTRTPWYISDKDGDAVLFVSDAGEQVVFERLYVELFGLDVLYRVLGPTPEDTAFTDVGSSDVDGNIIISSCSVEIPAIPGVAAEKPKAGKKTKAKKQAEEAPTPAPVSTIPTSGAPAIQPPTDEELITGDDADDDENESSLGPPTLGPAAG